VIPLFLLVPLLIGLFWGAPLVARELEQGTHRLVWTQGVTRRRWFSTKILLEAGTAAAGVGAFAALASWWGELLLRIHADRFDPGIFDLRGIVPIAYVLFALALGALMGTLMRRTLPAMAATLAGYIGVRTLVTLYVRPHYLAAKTVVDPLVAQGGGFKFGPEQIGNGAWILRQIIADRTGSIASPNDLFGFLSARCPGVISPTAPPSPGRLVACIHRFGVHTVTAYQPGGRFWVFQGIEAAIYVALAVLLVVVAGWIVRRRLA
jgi:hypothetical protein